MYFHVQYTLHYTIIILFWLKCSMFSYLRTDHYYYSGLLIQDHHCPVVNLPTTTSLTRNCMTLASLVPRPGPIPRFSMLLFQHVANIKRLGMGLGTRWNAIYIERLVQSQTWHLYRIVCTHIIHPIELRILLALEYYTMS